MLVCLSEFGSFDWSSIRFVLSLERRMGPIHPLLQEIRSPRFVFCVHSLLRFIKIGQSCQTYVVRSIY